MNLLWKLLRQHVSVFQLTGFFLANLVGMTIILFGLQFYVDVAPLFRGGDTVFRKEYLILSKSVSTLGSLFGSKGTFSEKEIRALGQQGFAHGVGRFTSSLYEVSATLGMEGTGLHVGTEMFFESVPDAYVDVETDRWAYKEGSRTIPIVLPRNYLNLYNFGFAQSRGLPRLSEGLLSLLHVGIRISGNGLSDRYEGQIVGFSDRLNTILVPEAFMTWANGHYAPGRKAAPSRLIVEVANPADEDIVQYLQAHAYEVEGDNLDAGRATWFLQILTGIVLAIGILITLLSLYVLLLSICLLLQKNMQKMQNLLLIGYSPFALALPYQALAVGFHLLATLLALGLARLLGSFYDGSLSALFPAWERGEGTLVWLAAGTLFVAVSALNAVIIRRSVARMWHPS